MAQFDNIAAELTTAELFDVAAGRPLPHADKLKDLTFPETPRAGIL